LSAKVVLVGLFAVVTSIVGEARAGSAVPIEFQFGGVFTSVSGTQAHQVGESFTTTVRFDPFASDAFPSSPNLGQYAFLLWNAPSFNANPFNFTLGTIRTALGSNNDTWRTDFSGDYGYALRLQFPPGTLGSDALPSTLNLSIATVAVFEADRVSTGFQLRGNITSLVIREVPEPTGLSILALMSAWLVRRVR